MTFVRPDGSGFPKVSAACEHEETQRTHSSSKAASRFFPVPYRFSSHRSHMEYLSRIGTSNRSSSTLVKRRKYDRNAHEALLAIGAPADLHPVKTELTLPFLSINTSRRWPLKTKCFLSPSVCTCLSLTGERTFVGGFLKDPRTTTSAYLQNSRSVPSELKQDLGFSVSSRWILTTCRHHMLAIARQVSKRPNADRSSKPRHPSDDCLSNFHKRKKLHVN